MPLAPDSYVRLCLRAKSLGLHVELRTDYRRSAAKPYDEEPPRVEALIITNAARQTLFEISTTLLGLERAAAAALERVQT